MARKKGQKNAVVPEDFSFENLSVEQTAPIQRQRNSQPVPLMFKESILESFLDGSGRKVTVPDDMASRTINLLRRGADELTEAGEYDVDTAPHGLGVSVQSEQNGDGTTTVHFQGKRRRKPRGAAADEADYSGDEGYTEDQIDAAFAQ